MNSTVICLIGVSRFLVFITFLDVRTTCYRCNYWWWYCSSRDHLVFEVSSTGMVRVVRVTGSRLRADRYECVSDREIAVEGGLGCGLFMVLQWLGKTWQGGSKDTCLVVSSGSSTPISLLVLSFLALVFREICYEVYVASSSLLPV